MDGIGFLDGFGFLMCPHLSDFHFPYWLLSQCTRLALENWRPVISCIIYFINALGVVFGYTLWSRFSTE